MEKIQHIAIFRANQLFISKALFNERLASWILNFDFRRQKSVQEVMQNLRRRLFKSIALLLDSWRYLAS